MSSGYDDMPSPQLTGAQVTTAFAVCAVALFIVAYLWWQYRAAIRQRQLEEATELALSIASVVAAAQHASETLSSVSAGVASVPVAALAVPQTVTAVASGASASALASARAFLATRLRLVTKLFKTHAD